MSIGHIDSSCHTCADDVILLVKLFFCLQLLIVVTFICREHAKNSAEVDLNKVVRQYEN